jgi:hypothetical protein
MHTKTRAHTLHYSLCSASNLLANVKYGVTRWIIAHAMPHTHTHSCTQDTQRHTALLFVQCINLLANVKYGVTRWIIAHANIGVAWLYNVVFTTALVAGSR